MKHKALPHSGESVKIEIEKFIKIKNGIEYRKRYNFFLFKEKIALGLSIFLI